MKRLDPWLPGCLLTPQELANLRGALLRDLRVEKWPPPLRKELEKWREEVGKCFVGGTKVY